VVSEQTFRRIAWTALFSVCLAATASATPIHPTPKQILKDARPAGEGFIPARAGWNGPENKKVSSINPMMQRFEPSAQARANRESLTALLLPDPRLWAFLILLIVGLRMLHLRAERRAARPVLVKQPPAEQPPSHLRAA
jgi:hypothetical protein